MTRSFYLHVSYAVRRQTRAKPQHGPEHLPQVQPSTISPPAQSSKARSCRSEQASVSSSISTTRLRSQKRNEEVKIKIWIYIHKPFTKQLSWYDARRYSTALSPRLFDVFRTCIRLPGCFLEHGAPGTYLQVVSLHLKSSTSLSASFAFCSILPWERA